MPKNVIVFSEDTGRVSAKKRKRIAGTVAKKKPEIKQCNTMTGHNIDYEAYTIKPVNSISYVTTDAKTIYPWRLIPLYYPLVGTESYNRIGNNIFLKSLRLKGYVTPTWRNLVKPIHWRLKLYRFDGEYPEPASANAVVQMQAYLGLFNNWETPAQASATSYTAAARHDFFKAIKKYPKLYNYSCKTIASGIIPLANKCFTSSGVAIGSAAQQIVEKGFERTSNNDCGCYPLDVIVKLNDRISWVRNAANTSYVQDIHYFFAFEDDFGIGIAIQEPSITIPSQGSPTFTGANWTLDITNPDNCCYTLSFFARWYYTDA